MKLKNMFAACALALSVMPFAASAELSKDQWLAKVGDCANNPSAMKATIAQIPASEQAEFVGKVNEAIGKKPASAESKAADFYAVNKAAVSGASDKSSVLAEVFATVPVEYLTDINERFATELFSRNANPENKPISDAAFTELATNALAVVNARCESAENAGVRQTFAALLFIRASGGSPEGLADTLVAQMTDPQAKESASSWIADAMGGEGKEATYNEMLDSTDAGAEPDHSVVLQMTGPAEITEALLADLQAPDNTSASGSPSGLGGGGFVAGSVAGSAVPSDGLPDSRLERIPRGAIGSGDGVGGNRDGTNEGEDNPYYSRRRGSTSGSEPFTPEPPDYVK